MSDEQRLIGRFVVARTAFGAFQFVGRVVSYSEAPTVAVKLPDGSTAHWRADMVKVLEMPFEAEDKLLPL